MCRPAFASIRQSRSGYGLVYFRFEYGGIFQSYNTPVNFLQLEHAACRRRTTSLSMVPSVSVTDDPRVASGMTAPIREKGILDMMGSR